MNFDRLKVVETVLDVQKVAYTSMISERSLRLASNNLELASLVDQRLRELVLSLTTYLLAREHKEVTEVLSMPADWWQMFKACWFPVWLLRRFPVRYREIVTKTYITKICPHLDMVLPDQKRVHIQWLEEET